MNLPNALKGIGQVLVYLVALYRIHFYILLLTVFFVLLPSFVGKIDTSNLDNIVKACNLESLYARVSDNILNPSDLSGGEKKKIEIARALYKKAPLIIFDEPTSNLDPKSATSIEELIFSLEGISKIVITHNQDKTYLSNFDHLINIEDYK